MEVDKNDCSSRECQIWKARKGCYGSDGKSSRRKLTIKEGEDTRMQL